MTPDSSTSTGSAAIQGDLWSARAQDWADVQELTQRPLYTSILQEVMQGSHVNLLDVGCGSGLFTAMAAAASRVSGLDAAAALLAVAKRRTPQANFRLGEMEALPYDSRSFDLVTGINSFQFAAHPLNALLEARRVGTPKARVIIATWGRMEECDTAAYFDALTPPGAEEKSESPGPFALSADGALADLARQAGLEPADVFDVDCPFNYPDEATALRGLLSPGPAVQAMKQRSEQRVREAVRNAIQPFRQNSGGYLLKNRFRYLIARVP